MSTAPSVGERLKDARERHGLQRVDVTRATKIYVHHLAALEFGRYDDLPDEEIVEAYVRAYADHLSLDGEELVRDLRRERGLPEPAPIAPVSPAQAAAPRSPRGTRRQARMVGAIFLAGAILVVAAIAIGSWLSREAALPAPSAPSAPSVTSTPTAPPAISAAPAPGPLSIAEHGVGTAVVDHRLIGAGVRFPIGTEVWFWTDVRGGAAGRTIRHVWIHEGRQIFGLDLPLGGAAWRTQSAWALRPGAAGEWEVQARDANSQILARSTFTCEP